MSGPKLLEHQFALRLGQPAEIEFIVIAQEQPPLGGSWPGLGRLESLCERTGIAGRHCIEQMLVDVEIEHHVHAVAVLAEIFHIGFGQDVGFGENDGVALPPLQKFAERAQHVVLLDRGSDLRTLGGDHERDRIHPEAGHAELNPEPHDLEDLGLDVRVRGVEVRLKVVEAMKVPGLGFLIVGPCRFLHAGKHHSLVGIGGPLVGPDIPIAIWQIRRASSRGETTDGHRRCG